MNILGKLNVKDQLKKLKEKGAFHILVGNFVTKFVTFFGSIFIVRLLSKTEYGILGYIENLYSIAYLFAGLGLSNAILRYVIVADTLEEKNSYYRYCKNRAYIYNLIIFFVFSMVAILYPHTKGFESAKYLLIIMLITLPFQYLFDNNLSTERAFFNNRRYAILALMSATSIVFGKCLGAFVDGILGVIICVIIVNVFFAIFSSYKISVSYFKNVAIDELEKPQKRKANVYGFQYMITNGLWALFMLIDVFLIGRLTGDPSVLADYKVAYVWPGNIGIFCSGIAVFVTPYFVKNENNHSWVKSNYIKLLMINIAIVGFVGIIMAIFAKPLIYIYAGKQYLNTVNIMRLLLISAFINNALRATTANVLAAMGQVKYNMIIAFLGIISEVVLDIFLIERLGILGVAFAGICTYSFMAVAVFMVFSKKYKLFNRD